MRIKLTILLMAIVLLLAGCIAANNDDEQDPGEVKNGYPVDLVDINLIEQDILITGYNNDLKLSPDGKKVAFSGYHWDYDTQNLESKTVLGDLTSGQTTVYNNAGRVMSWLGDSTKIIYVGDNTFGILDVNTGEAEEIAPIWTHAALSPDGKSIAYTVRGKIYPWETDTLPESESGLWVYDLATGNKKQLTNNAEDWYPVWYPDSKRLFYFSDLGVELGDGAGHLQGMAIIGLDGEKHDILSDETGKFRRAEWIVPGKSLFIAGGWDDGFNYNILKLEDNTYVNIADDVNAITPDFVSVDNKNGQVIKSGGGKVEFYDASGNKTSEYSLPEQDMHNYNYTVSPDGNMLAFIYGDFGRSIDSKINGNLVKLTSLDGSDVQSLTTEYKYNESIIWDRSGRHVLTLQADTVDAVERIALLKVLPVE